MMSELTKIRKLLAPRGSLCASINVGNPVLARREGPQGSPYGVSVDIASELGRRLGIGVEFVVFDSAQQSVEAIANEEADVGFFAIDPKRGETIAFTSAYLNIEGWYAVRQDSPIQAVSQVDRNGVRVVVSRGSAYDLFLTRELKHAEIVRAPNPQAVTPLFLEQQLEVIAGVKQQLELDMQRYPGLRQLPDRFMVIRQAMGLARNRGYEAHAYLSAFIEEMKKEGFIELLLIRQDIQGVTVPPAQESS